MDKSRLVSVALSIRALCAQCAVKWRALPGTNPKTLPGLGWETAQRGKDQPGAFLFILLLKQNLISDRFFFSAFAVKTCSVVFSQRLVFQLGSVPLNSAICFVGKLFSLPLPDSFCHLLSVSASLPRPPLRSFCLEHRIVVFVDITYQT